MRFTRARHDDAESLSDGTITLSGDATAEKGTPVTEKEVGKGVPVI